MTRDEADNLQFLIDEYSKISTPNSMYFLLKIQLANCIENEMFGSETSRMATSAIMLMIFFDLIELDDRGNRSILPVVDGHQNADPDSDDYESSYCVRVPLDIMKEAIHIRMNKFAYEIANRGIVDDHELG